MADEHVRQMGQLEDDYGRVLRVGVDYGRVTFGNWTLTRRQAVAFQRLFLGAYGAAAAYGATHADDDNPPAIKWCGVCNTAGHTSDEHDAQAAVNEVLAALATRLQSDATRPDL